MKYKLTKKLLSLLLTALMIASIFPFASILTLAEATPIATATLRTGPRLDGYMTEPAPDESGWASQPRQYALTNVKDVNGKVLIDVDQAYCINHGATFINKDLTRYYGYRASDSAYFQTFNETQQMGILLVSAFGYNGTNDSEWMSLGLTEPAEAIAATQALVWEFNVGSRISFEGEADEGDNPDWAYSMVKNVEGANTAYWHILASAQEWIDNGGNWKDLLEDEGMIVWEQSNTDDHWEQGNAQVILSYTGEKPVEPFGSISVRKTDINGTLLNGAEFTIYYADKNSENYGQRLGDPLVTGYDENGQKSTDGFAITKGGLVDPIVPYGTYRIVETKYPTYTDDSGNVVNYVPVGPTSWTVVVDETHKHITVNATNRKDVKVMVTKTYEGDNDIGSYMKFAIYDEETNERLLTLETDANGKSAAVVLPQTESGRYRWEEISDGPFSCLAWNGTEWTGDADVWTFEYDDIEPGTTLELKAKNILSSGFAKIKKVTTDGSSVNGFKFEITKTDDPDFKLTGVSNKSGYVMTGSKLGVLAVDAYQPYKTIGSIKASLWTCAHKSDSVNYVFLAPADMLISEVIRAAEEWQAGTYTVCNGNSYSEDTINSYTVREFATEGASLLRNGQNLGWLIPGEVPTNFKNIPSRIEGMLTTWASLGNGDRISVNELIVYLTENNGQFVHDTGTFDGFEFIFDANFDGYIDAEDKAMYQDAVDEGRDYVESPVITLAPGEYTITETLGVGQEYYAEPAPKNFVVEPDKTIEVTFTNRPAESSILIVKESEDGVIADVKFQITGALASGSSFNYVGTTDANGELYVAYDENNRKVIAGTYTVTELDVSGQYIAPQSQTIVITAADAQNGKTIPVRFTNSLKPVPITISKTSEDGIVEGISFKLYGYTKSGEYIDKTFVTNANGIISTTLAPGKYTVVELALADGRYVTNAPQTIEPYIDANGVAHNNTVSFYNTLKKFTLTLNKTDGLTSKVEGDGTLSGAVYGLYKDGVLVESKTTDANGMIVFTTQICEIGYTVQEISPSEGYYLDSTVYDIDTNPLNHDVENAELTLNITEQPIMGTISIYKLVGTEEDNAPEAGAVFQVYLKSAGSYANASATQRDTITTDAANPTDDMGYFGGIATTKDLPYGTYVVHQVSGDSRFSLVDDFEVVIDEENVNTCYTKINLSTPKTITVTKTDLTGETLLKGAVLVVEDTEGNKQEGTTDENGEISFTLIPAQTYKLYEIAAPEGYSLNTTPVTFTVDIYGNISAGTTNIKNEPNKYTVKKTDSDGNPLAGATFEMKNVATGKVFASKVTGSDGLAVFELIPFGEYTVYESKAPAGYKRSDKEVKLEITSTWQNITDSDFNDIFVNNDIIVSLGKKDAVTTLGVAGAEITIYDSTGKVYAKGNTNEEGIYTVKNIPAGNYTFKETYAPEGYELNTNEFEFEVTEDGEVIGDNVVLDDPNKFVVKKVDKNGNAIPGATFEMVNDVSGDVFATLTSGSDGIVVFEYIPHGKYTIREIAAPNGFKLSDAEIKLEITENWQNIEEGEFNEAFLNEDTVVVFTKRDSVTGAGVEGAKFTIYDEGGNVYASGVTNENGEYTIANIVPGKYTLKETAAPVGYELNTDTFEFEVDENGEVSGSTVITNEPNRYVVKKTDSEGNALSGATFEMVNDATGKVFDTKTSGADGIVVFEYIPHGNYTIRETAVPAGYKLSKQEIKVTIDSSWANLESGAINETVVNYDTTVTFEKTDATTSAGVPGAEITIYTESGDVYTSGITDEYGKFTVTNIVPGKYTFKETYAPAGYQLNTTVFEFTVSEDGEVTGDNLVTDEPVKVVILKTDAETGLALKGAEIAIFDVSGNEVFKDTTDDNGFITATYLKPGKYTFKELKAPEGYKLNTSVYNFEVTEDGEVIGDNTISNEPIEVVISKTDAITGELLTGAEIVIKDDEGNEVLKDVTNDDGVISITHLKPGKYTYQELVAPAGYELNSNVYEFEITAEGDIVGELIISNNPIRIVVNKTDEEGNPLAGATFELIDSATNEVIDTQISDENGIAVFEYVPHGEYIIRETAVPAGYELYKEDINVTVDASWRNVAEGEYNITVVNYNTVVSFEKKDASTGESVPGAEITVYDEAGEIYAQGVTDETGRFTITNIIPGKYTFKETYAPAGYELNTTVFEFEVTVEGDVIGDNVITNDPVKVIISKTDINGEIFISGAEITIYDEEGNEVFRGLTGEDGTIVATYLKPGTYTFKETCAASGWAINTTVFTFTVADDGAVTGDDTITDDITRITIYKVNERDEPMAEVVFNVYSINGSLVATATTDENGIAVFEGLKWNEYIIKEVSTLDGYMMSTDSIKITIDGKWDNQSEIAHIEVVNYPKLQAGDTTNMLIYAILAVFSVFCAVILFKNKRKHFSF